MDGAVLLSLGELHIHPLHRVRKKVSVGDGYAILLHVPEICGRPANGFDVGSSRLVASY
jgi:hypothetical protein